MRRKPFNSCNRENMKKKKVDRDSRCVLCRGGCICEYLSLISRDHIFVHDGCAFVKIYSIFWKIWIFLFLKKYRYLGNNLTKLNKKKFNAIGLLYLYKNTFLIILMNENWEKKNSCKITKSRYLYKNSFVPVSWNIETKGSSKTLKQYFRMYIEKTSNLQKCELNLFFICFLMPSKVFVNRSPFVLKSLC